MAERRMFTKKVTESDAFLEMPSSTQCLYFHLNMEADDDGFVNNPKRVQRMVGVSDDDMKLLIAKRFIIIFESGIIVIKHWKMHNYIQNDRYRPTDYVDEKSILELKKNKAYTLNVSTLDTECIQDVSVGKVRIGKDRIGKDIKNIVQQDCTAKVSKAEIDTFFESVWNLYPNKKGKDQVSDVKKKKLYELGLDKLSTAIQRYKSELAKETWRKEQNCSTFFNSGYVDYLDGNYTPGATEPKAKSKNSQHNFEQRSYSAQDYADLEKKLLNKGL